MDFTWKGIRSTAKGIEVTVLPPVVSATRRDEPHAIPYRSGSLHMQDGALEEIIKPCSVYLPYEQGRTVAALRELKAWLTGYDWVEFSNDPGRKYRGHIISQIDWTEWMAGFEDREAQIIWECEPYAYHTDAQEITVTSSGTNVINPGTAEARPLIEITGSGQAELMIGGEIIQLDEVGGTIYLDCEAEEAYAMDGQIRINKNGVMTGDFQTLSPGSNMIAWTGSVTQLRLTPRWRDI